MAYARVATGYRPGGPNPTSTVCGLPPHFNPDKTRNYEIGVKGDVLGRLLSFDASM
jgi:iron complex outermembrane recepter protein